MRRLSNFLLFFLCIIQAEAKMSDADQPLNIEAGSVEIREKEGISIYKNNVRITRGTMVIQGELIHVHSAEDKIQTIRIEGSPAKYRQLNEQGEEVSAQSQEMEYQARENKLILKKDAILVQGQNRFTSEHIVYDTKQDIVQAGDPEQTTNSSESDRVTITIQPEKKKDPE